MFFSQFFCKRALVTTNHLFLHCHWTFNIWSHFLSLINTPWTQPETCLQAFYCWETLLTAEDRADLVNALKSKLQTLAANHPDDVFTLTPNVRKRIEVLKEIQVQHDELEAKFYEERAALEAKYQKLYEPLYSKRYEIVNGVVEVAVDQEDDKDTGEKGVPEFWLTAMKTNDVLSEEISERDEGALKYLKDIKWCKFDDHKGFKLEFFFDSNPYFKNTVLTKTYHMIDYKKSILEKAIGTEIEWLPGKSLKQKVLKMKREKGAKPRIITKTCESFFNFFTPPVVPEDDDDVDEEAVEEFQNLLEQDYEIGSTIREKIIPNAVSWFTGEAAVEDEFDTRGDVDKEDEDEEDDDDEDDEDEDDEGKSRKKKIGRTIGEGQQAERPPDCKQQ